MTVIVALKTEDDIIMGADSCVTRSGHTLTVGEAKVKRIGGMLWGISGSSVFWQRLPYQLKVPVHPPGVSTDEYMVTLLADELTRHIQEDCTGIMDETKKDGASFLIAYQSSIYSASTHGLMAEYDLPYIAIGAGSSFALGALHAQIEDPGISPRLRVLRALEAASYFNPNCAGPYTVLSLNKGDDGPCT
jgi:ATP-dependent protease HslVU (ClpYQ) peptidase subunit